MQRSNVRETATVKQIKYKNKVNKLDVRIEKCVLIFSNSNRFCV